MSDASDTPKSKVCDSKSRLNAEEYERYLRIRMRGSVPTEFCECRFDAAEFLAGIVRGGPERVDFAQRACANMADSDGAVRITLEGPAGVGKSVLGTAIWSELISTLPWGLVSVCPEDGEDAASLWVDAAELGEEIARSKGRKAQDRITQAKRAPYLLLDDLGAEAPFGSAAVAAIGSIIRYRYNASARTIFTTGFSREELAALYGAGVLRRIFDRAVLIAWGTCR